MRPVHTPSVTARTRRGSASARTHRKRARRCAPGTPRSRRSSLALLARSSPCPPAKRAERTPGAPSSTSTSSPESSAITHPPVRRAAARAFLSALSRKVRPSSRTDGMRGASRNDRHRTRCGSLGTVRSAVSSRNFFGLLVAMMISTGDDERRTEAAGLEVTRTLDAQRLALQGDQLRNGAAGQTHELLEVARIKGPPLRGALQLDEGAAAGHDDVHVDVGC